MKLESPFNVFCFVLYDAVRQSTFVTASTFWLPCEVSEACSSRQHCAQAVTGTSLRHVVSISGAPRLSSVDLGGGGGRAARQSTSWLSGLLGFITERCSPFNYSTTPVRAASTTGNLSTSRGPHSS